MLGAGALISLVFTTADYVRPAPQTIEVAKGIYLFITRPYGEVGLDGNSVAILSNDGVLVFDSNGTPAAISSRSPTALPPDEHPWAASA